MIAGTQEFTRTAGSCHKITCRVASVRRVSPHLGDRVGPDRHACLILGLAAFVVESAPPSAKVDCGAQQSIIIRDARSDRSPNYPALSISRRGACSQLPYPEIHYRSYHFYSSSNLTLAHSVTRYTSAATTVFQSETLKVQNSQVSGVKTTPINKTRQRTCFPQRQ